LLELFDLDIEAISSETFKIKHDLLGTNPFYEKEEEIENKVKNTDLKCNGPGLIYYIDFGVNTFCIKAWPCENIDQSLDFLNQGLFDELAYQASLEKKLCIFETDSLEEAEIIVDQMAKRRFPYLEDMLCNLSDPGYSWWLDLSKNRIKIHFKSYGINRQNNLIKLGPICDYKIAQRRFKQLFALEYTSNLCFFESSDKSFMIQGNYGFTDRMQLLKDCLIDGQVCENQLNFFNSTMKERTLFYFLKELAEIRSFWLAIEQKIADKTSQLQEKHSSSFNM